MLWKIKGFPVIYIVLLVLTGAFLVYFLQNFKVEDSQDVNKTEDNQLSVLGANSSNIPFATPSSAAITAQNQTIAGPQTPTAKPTPTPTPKSTMTPSPSPTQSPTPEPSATTTPSPTPTVSPTPSPSGLPSPTPTATP